MVFHRIMSPLPLRILAGIALSLCLAAHAEPPTPQLVDFPTTTLGPAQLAVVANAADPASLEVANYYLGKRGIPMENLIIVRFRPDRARLAPTEFERLRREIVARTPASIQAYALAWTIPYRVDCMSLPSALAFGFDPAYCSARRCAPTRTSPYFGSGSRAPFRDHGLRPVMMLAGRDVAAVKALIDRGVAADRTYPDGTGYLVNTPDRSRSIRANWFDDTVRSLRPAVRLERLDTDGIRDRHDVLFYFTGAIHVPYLDTLAFRPGALADHLTSAGGQLNGTAQMSVLRWLEAGATASYGTVVEPCNLPGKFPFPALAMGHYLSGETAIEAYWKSVQQPGEGLFVGEPLASPFAPQVRKVPDGYEATLFVPTSEFLTLERSPSVVGPFVPTPTQFELQPGLNRIAWQLPADSASYRLTLGPVLHRRTDGAAVRRPAR